MKKLLLLSTFLLLMPVALLASPQQAYEKAMVLAASGHDSEAVAHLQGAVAVMSNTDAWQERMTLAVMLLDMRRYQRVELTKSNRPSTHVRLADAYLKEHGRPEVKDSWLPGVLASIFPGAGHAWQGRLKDALVAAVMVWPLLILTLWAAYRRMGPVTVFFTLMTAWLWSGTVFSAVSLAERGDFEVYIVWWQGLWQASALPGRPW
jgi:hypothetical protein